MDFLLVEIAIGTMIILAVTALAFAFIAWISQAERADHLADLRLSAAHGIPATPHPDAVPTMRVSAPSAPTPPTSKLSASKPSVAVPPAGEDVWEREPVLA